MEIEVLGVERLRFADGSPVRAASAVAPFGNGYLVVQDDATHAAWFVHGSVTPVRLLPPVDGLDVFEESAGTKHLKPDLEAACPVTVDDVPGVLMLGSGSSPARTRVALIRLERGSPRVDVADLAAVYTAVADALSVSPDFLNLEGACLVGGAVRWFHRGLPSAGMPSGSVDLDSFALLAATLGRAEPETIAVTNPLHYELGEVGGVGLALTDAVALPGGAILASAVAEDSPNPRDDGPVTGSALVLLDGDGVREVAVLPPVEGQASKVEGLMVLSADDVEVQLRAVVDVDDPGTPSQAIRLHVRR
jgi:hypothetical protein